MAQDFSPRLSNLYPVRFVRDTAIVGEPGLVQHRRKAIEFSDAYYTRAKIHKIASFAMIPLFVAQYVSGRQLYDQGNQAPSWARNLHRPLAVAVTGLFVVNTVTGVWNLVEGWKAPEGRTRRTVHGALMLLAGAGFVATDMTGPHVRNSGVISGNPNLHRALGIASMSTALGSYLMMLIWN